MSGPEGSSPASARPADWPTQVLKVRVDGARGPKATPAIAAVAALVGERRWQVSTFETNETWAILHLPAGRGRDGSALPRERDRGALADVEGLVGALETASVQVRRAFVLILGDEEVGRVADGRRSAELESELLAPWRDAVAPRPPAGS